MGKRTVIFLFLLPALLSEPAAGARPVKIAAVFSATGIAAAHNGPMIEMTELAVAEVNRAGGLLGRPIELIHLDNQSKPLGASLAAEEAVDRGVTAVIGGHWSSHSLAMAPVLQAAGIPMISPTSTNPEVTRIGDYIFRACFLDSFQGNAMGRFAATELGARTAAILRNIDEAYSLTLADYFKDSFLAHGGSVPMDEGYRGKAVDFSEILQGVARLSPSVVYIPGYTRDSGLIIKQAAAMGVETTYIGGDAWDEISEYAGKALDGSYHSSPWHPKVPFARSIHLRKIYRKTFGREISSINAPLAYDAVLLLADAVERAGSLDRRRIRDALAATQGFRGATGVISFDENGDPRDKAVIVLRFEGDTARYHETLHP